MKINAQEIQAVSAAQSSTRVDLYVGIHKAMRAMMADALLAVGRMDPLDAVERNAVGARVLDLLDFCMSHLRHENQFVHTAIEARAPGASEAVAHDHVEHEANIARLKAVTETLRGSTDASGATLAALGLYRDLALFVAENFQHMHTEETAHNTVLWARYTDAELMGIHGALVASIPPVEMLRTMRWLVPYMNPGERTAMLAGMQAHAPAPAFAATMDTVRPHLTETEWAKLTRSLGLPPLPGLVLA